MKRMLVFLLLSVSFLCFGQNVVVLTETPVAEFMLPDGSVLKNAFVWRRSSEGLMIVHDEGQYFLNFALLPDDWKAAYLGTPVEPAADNEPAEEQVTLDDRYKLEPLLKEIKALSPAGRTFVLRENADKMSSDAAISLALFQSLLSNNVDEARRIYLILEEKGLDIEAVRRENIFSECGTCEGEGTVSVVCSKCSGSGKCSKCGGSGQRETGIGKSTIHCTACRGKGDCPGCQGSGALTSRCRACYGRGMLVNKPYCEVQCDHLVHQVNAIANKGQGLVITKAEKDRIFKVMKELPGLDSEARGFYFSDAYDGSMDTNILAACVIQSLMKDRLDEAKRFFLMVEAYYPEGDVLELETYLKPCKTCDSTGRVERKCSSCEGTGKCARCGGDGQRDTDFLDRTINCGTCRGLGKCPECGGDGVKTFRCSVCEGIGREFEEERAEIKRQLLVEALNDYFKRRP